MGDAGGTQIIDYARRTLAARGSGRGFDSPHLHPIAKPPANGWGLFLLGPRGRSLVSKVASRLYGPDSSAAFWVVYSFFDKRSKTQRLSCPGIPITLARAVSLLVDRLCQPRMTSYNRGRLVAGARSRCGGGQQAMAR